MFYALAKSCMALNLVPYDSWKVNFHRDHTPNIYEEVIFMIIQRRSSAVEYAELLGDERYDEA